MFPARPRTLFVHALVCVGLVKRTRCGPAEGRERARTRLSATLVAPRAAGPGGCAPLVLVGKLT
jgi:hypothetical protein